MMNEFMDLKHAELVPEGDLNNPSQVTFYLPMHAIRKEESTMTKLRVIFDASAKFSIGISLNNSVLVGPTIYPPLISVLLWFCTHRVALTTDVSKMYRAVELVPVDKDLHRFVWRNNPKDPLLDCRMIRVTFGVSASSFAANMAVKQNALDYAMEYPLAAKSMDDSFYVDDGLTGADFIQEAIELQCQLQDLFSKGGFYLRKWNSSDHEPQAIQHLPAELKDMKPTQELPTSDEYTKTLGIQWNALKDCFKLSVPSPTPLKIWTKKTWPCLWCGKELWCTRLVLPLHHQSQNSHAAALGARGWLGWPCAWRQSSRMAIMENRATPTLSDDNSPLLLWQGVSDTLYQIHGFFYASELAYAAVVYISTTDTKKSHPCITSDVKGQGCTHQAADDTSLGAMWSAVVSSTHPPCQTSTWHPPLSCTCLDWQYNRT